MDFDSLLAQAQAFIVWLWGFWEVKVLLLHILANVVVAIAASIRTNEFLLGKLAEFLWRKVLPLVAVFGVLAFVGDTLEVGGLSTATWLALETLLLADLADNLKKLGLPIPDSLTKGPAFKE